MALPFKGEKIWREAIMRAVKRKESKKDPHALERLADQLVAQGLGGDVTALKEIGDRLDGKPNQTVDVTNRYDFQALHDAIAKGVGTVGTGLDQQSEQPAPVRH